MTAARLACFDTGRLPGVGDTQRQVAEAVRRFVEGEIMPFADAWDEAETFPRDLYRKAADIGLLGLGYPTEYGGTQADHVSRVLATIELCRGGIGGVNASLMTHTIMIWPLLAGASHHAARLMRDCADGAVQILGGAGFMRGSRIERTYRDAKVYMIGGGAEEVMNEPAAKQLGLL